MEGGNEMSSPTQKRRLWTVLICLLLLAPGAATAAPGAGPRLSGADESQSPFLLKSTDARVVVTGPVAHAVVTQSWENPNSFVVDGLYIFPLPTGAAVTDMSLRIGDRIIQGEMKRRQEARAIYDQARREGRVAGLLEQERPNVFAQQVANIVPGTPIQVVLSFDQEVGCDGGACEYVFPTVVGPRFIPCRQADPGKIDPPVLYPHQSTGHRLSLRLVLDAGVEAHDLESPSHRVIVSRDGEGRARVRLAEDGPGLLDRDFRLRWRVGGDALELGVLVWRNGSAEGEPGVFTLLLQPPAGAEDEEGAEPRELVFVLDCSGSMRGVPLEAAKNVVRKALAAARPGDTFRIVRFSDRTSGLSRSPLLVTPANLRLAGSYLDSLEGEGGTEMVLGIRAALQEPADSERLRIVAFLTDGYIGNEREILGEVRRSLGSARLFSFGIGDSVNRYLLEGLAEEGRGEAAFLAPRESPDALVDRFVRRIATPVLTDIRLNWDDLEVEDQEPRVIPDLFAGSPLVIHGRYARPGTGLLMVEGTVRGRHRIFRRVVTLPAEAADHEALGRLWARARIHRLERELHDGSRPDLAEAITTLGLRHHLMTAYTSLVAVDSEVSNWTGSSTQMIVPVEMPQDVSYEGTFGVAGKKGNGAGWPGAQALPGIAGGVLFRSLPPPASRPETQDGPSAPGREKAIAPGAAAGRVASPADRGDLSAPPAALPENGGHKDAAYPFSRVTLTLPDGTELSVKSDGELWKVQGKMRTLLGDLSPAEMDQFRRLLAAARPGTWTGGGSSGRILYEGAGGTRVASYPSGDPALRALADWIRARAS